MIRQIYNVGVLSLIIIVLSAFSIIGAVIALQFYTQLARFGAEDAVGLGLALVLLRELGPVVTGLLFAGRAGSAVTAEIGLMKSSEQLSSMEMMGVDPLRRIVAPRLWAGCDQPASVDRHVQRGGHLRWHGGGRGVAGSRMPAPSGRACRIRWSSGTMWAKA